MNTITKYVDLSTKSLVIAGIILIIVSLTTKYGFDLYNKDHKEDEKRSNHLIIVYSVITGFIFSFLSLIAYKQFCKYGACDISTEPFPR